MISGHFPEVGLFLIASHLHFSVILIYGVVLIGQINQFDFHEARTGHHQVANQVIYPFGCPGSPYKNGNNIILCTHSTRDYEYRSLKNGLII